MKALINLPTCEAGRAPSSQSQTERNGKGHEQDLYGH